MHGPTICRRRRAVVLGHRVDPPGKHVRRYEFESGDVPVGLGGTTARITEKRMGACFSPSRIRVILRLRGCTSERGRSSVVERQLTKLYVEGSIPFARSIT